MLITQFKLVTEEEETASRSNNSIKTIITHHASETTVVQAPNDMFHPKRSRKIGELCKCRIDQLRFDNLCHHNKRRLVKDNKAAISSNCPNLSHSQFPQSKFISALFMRKILGQQQQHDEGIHAREKKCFRSMLKLSFFINSLLLFSESVIGEREKNMTFNYSWLFLCPIGAETCKTFP